MPKILFVWNNFCNFSCLYIGTKTRTYSEKIWMFLKMKWWISQKEMSQFQKLFHNLLILSGSWKWYNIFKCHFLFLVFLFLAKIIVLLSKVWLLRRKMDFWLRFNLMRSLLTWNPWEHKSQSSIKRKLLYKRPILLVRQQRKDIRNVFVIISEAGECFHQLCLGF